ncbi:phosphonate C-P lyase system protein PhnG [Pseudoprimorskyibacter insulae]|uniref:Alpha-D-ribose 1-methylphosphonate 5-triphosphate synthase subunit PhnG n=1 Tax=Pseudoprimorskyibacter insulae TaxID=1695997 RepID=A0A2R8ANH3_9RHOB|nr:phosphonate C-P lyase system protein PhnG [Pseudoprimorskyibacter insulae]SPF77427.1 Alpha-D-ribose 1-methylphosphonate 5-triphosphate synthase subunit PhnG [Pseudoprimorskyibacter insulae]
MQAVHSPSDAERKTWLSLLAKADAAQLADCVAHFNDTAFDWLRQPEIGSVMVRGRAGGTGAAFNLGELTITRCALRLTGSEAVGYGHVQGRDKTHARNAALVDALMQTAHADDVMAHVLTPLQRTQDAKAKARAEKAAATKVEFFTMVRGED